MDNKDSVNIIKNHCRTGLDMSNYYKTPICADGAFKIPLPTNKDEGFSIPTPDCGDSGFYKDMKLRHENTYNNDERLKKELQDIYDNIRELSSKYEFKFDKVDSMLEGVKCTIEKHKDIICKQLVEDLGIDPKLYNVVYKISAGDDYKVKIEFDVVKKERVIKGIIDLDAEHPSLY